MSDGTRGDMEAVLAAHALDSKARPPTCRCKAQWAGSPTFVRARHATHVAAALRDAGYRPPRRGVVSGDMGLTEAEREALLNGGRQGGETERGRIVREAERITADRERAAAVGALRDAAEALFRGEGPDPYAEADVVFSEWLGNYADRLAAAVGETP